MESSRRRSSTVRDLASEQATERAPQNLFLLCVRVAARRVAQREIYVLYCSYVLYVLGLSLGHMESGAGTWSGC